MSAYLEVIADTVDPPAKPAFEDPPAEIVNFIP